MKYTARRALALLLALLLMVPNFVFAEDLDQGGAYNVEAMPNDVGELTLADLALDDIDEDAPDAEGLLDDEAPADAGADEAMPEAEELPEEAQPEDQVEEAQPEAGDAEDAVEIELEDEPQETDLAVEELAEEAAEAAEETEAEEATEVESETLPEEEVEGEEQSAEETAADDAALAGDISSAEALQNAINAIGEGNADTIKLAENVEIVLTSAITLKTNSTVTLDMNGGTIKSASSAFNINQAKLILKGNGTIDCTEQTGNSVAIWVNGSATDPGNYRYGLDIGSGITIKAHAWGLGVWYGGTVDGITGSYGVQVNINGTIEAPAGITLTGSINGQSGNIPVINFKGTLIGGGLYASGYAKYILDGTIQNTEDEGAAIEIRAGEMTINGGNYSATSSPTSVSANGNGTTTSGAALAVAQHTTKQPIKVTVNGGTFSAYTPFNEYNPQDNPQLDIEKIKFAINDGNFIVTNGGNSSVASQNVTGFISGGTYSKAPESGYIADGLEAVPEDGVWEIEPPTPAEATVSEDGSKVTVTSAGGTKVEDITIECAYADESGLDDSMFDKTAIVEAAIKALFAEEWHDDTNIVEITIGKKFEKVASSEQKHVIYSVSVYAKATAKVGASKTYNTIELPISNAWIKPGAIFNFTLDLSGSGFAAGDAVLVNHISSDESYPVETKRMVVKDNSTVDVAISHFSTLEVVPNTDISTIYINYIPNIDPMNNATDAKPQVAKTNTPVQLMPSSTFTWAGHTLTAWMDTDMNVYAPSEVVTFTEPEDVELYAVWDADLYTINFWDETGEINWQTGKWNSGERPVYNNGVNPVKEGYTFRGWSVSKPAANATTKDTDPYFSGDLPEVTAAADYYAVFASTADVHTVTWMDEDGTTILRQDEYYHGAVPAYGETTTLPTKESTAQYSYAFSGWQNGNKFYDKGAKLPAVTEDVTYTLVFEPTVRQYWVVFMNKEFGVADTTKAEDKLNSTLYDYGTKAADIVLPVEPTKAEDANYTYTFDKWSPVISDVVGETFYYPTYTKTPKPFTVRWMDYDGSQLLSEQYNYGDLPFYPNGNPTRESDDGHDYTFKDWTYPIQKVTQDQTYIATYVKDTRSYLVSFVDDEGNLISERMLNYGATITVPATPAKAPDEQSTYTFAGWKSSRTGKVLAESDFATKSVMGYETFTAQFTPSTRYYGITFVMDDGATVHKAQTNYTYGAIPNYGKAPTKAADQQYHYVFAGWSPEVAPVTDNMTYRATFTAIKNTFTVTWKDYDGTVLDVESYEYGAVPSYKKDVPSVPENAVESYVFKEWSPAIAAVTQSTTYKATYTNVVNKYQITFNDEDGTLIDMKDDYTFDADITVPANPTKAQDDEFTYTFDGFVSDLYGRKVKADTTPKAKVKGNETFTATYKAEVRKYQVTFKYANETEISSITKEYEYGTDLNPLVSEPPVPTGDDAARAGLDLVHYDYTFVGWTGNGLSEPTKTLPEVTGPATYTAVFEGTPKEFTITFVNIQSPQNPADTVIDTAVLEVVKLPYGAYPAYSGDEDQLQPLAKSTGDNDGYNYEFDGWTNAADTTATLYYDKLPPVGGNTLYRAHYAFEQKKFTVIFRNDDGSVIAMESKPWGADINNTPARQESVKGLVKKSNPDPQIQYTFYGWKDIDDGNVYDINYTHNNMPSVFRDTTYVPVFTETAKKYTVNFNGADGKAISSTQYDYGTPASDIQKPADPTKTTPDGYTYTFKGWTPEIADVTANAWYNPVFEATPIKYTVTWEDDDGNVIDTELYDYDTMPSFKKATPTKAADAGNTYVFKEWVKKGTTDKKIAKVTGNVTYKATFTPTANQYPVTFVDEDGNVISSTTYTHGADTINVPNAPEKEATAEYTYQCTSWQSNPTGYTLNASNQISPTVSSPVTFTPVYTATKRAYEVRFMDGDKLLSKMDYQYGTVITRDAPSTTGKDDHYEYTFLGWDDGDGNVSLNIPMVTGPATYHAVFFAAPKLYTVKFVNSTAKNSGVSTAVLETVEVPYGSIPAFSGTEPQPTDAAVGSTSVFSGWTTDRTTIHSDKLPPVEGNVTYYAHYATTTDTFRVTFYAYDGVTVLKDEVHGYNYDINQINVGAVTHPEELNYTYTFYGWTTPSSAVYESGKLPKLTADASYIAYFLKTPKKYTVTFNDADGHLLQSGEYDYDTPARDIQKPADPTKAADQGHTYKFTGWTPEIVDVTSNAWYNPVFEATKKSFTVTWKSEGAVLSVETYEYEDMPSYKGVTPTKAAADGKTYTFKEWVKESDASKKIGKVEANITYVATFSDTTDQCTVTFVDENGNVISDNTYVYGTENIKVPTAPAKAATVENTYECTSWQSNPAGYTLDSSNKISPALTTSVTFSPVYTATKQKYEIRFLNDDDSLLSSALYDYGTIITRPNPTTKQTDTHYTYYFMGWDSGDGEPVMNIPMVTGPATYRAVFFSVPESYTITFINATKDNSEKPGVVLCITNAYYGERPVYDGETPEPTDKAVGTTSVFNGWRVSNYPTVYTDELPIAAGDTTYVANYVSTEDKFTVTLIDTDGFVMAKFTDLPYNFNLSATSKTFPAIPIPSDPNYEYSVRGWMSEAGVIYASIGPLAPVTADATYTIVYNKTPKTYSVVFYDAKGAALSTTSYPYGTPAEDIVLPPVPQKDPDGYTYTFKGWDPQVVKVTGPAKYYPVYDKTPNEYIVTWLDEDGVTELSTETYFYGDTPIYTGVTPTKESDSQNSYRFKEWIKVWENGTSIAPANREHISRVEHDVKYQATYTDNLNDYTVTFVTEDGKVLSTNTYPWGTTQINVPAIPAKASTAEHTYTFAGWVSNPAGTTVSASNGTLSSGVAADMIFTATYTEHVAEYEIRFVSEDGRTVYYHPMLAYGTVPSWPANADLPTKEATAQYSYTFAGWADANDDVWPMLPKVTGPATYRATFTETVNMVPINFWNNDFSDLLQTGEVPYGTIPSYDGDLVPVGYTDGMTYEFKGWVDAAKSTDISGNTFDRSGTHFTGDLPAATAPVNYIATYDIDYIYHTITWTNWDDSVLAISRVLHKGQPSYPNTTNPTRPETDEYSYAFRAWVGNGVEYASGDQVPLATEDATYKAVYTPTKRNYTVTFLGEKDKNGNYPTLYSGTYPYGTRWQDIVQPPTTPTKEADEKNTYTFSGWYPELEDVTADAYYYAKFDATPRTYLVTWINEDGTELYRNWYEYGVIPSYPYDYPTKPGDSTNSYAFKCWIEYIVQNKPSPVTTQPTPTPVPKDTMISAVTKDVTYMATYTSEKNVYTVTFVDWDGTVICTRDYNYGDELVLPKMSDVTPTPAPTAPTANATAAKDYIPTRASDYKYDYTFSGWMPTMTRGTIPGTCIGNMVFVAQYTPTLRKYTVTFLDEAGNKLENGSIPFPYGSYPFYSTVKVNADGSTTVDPADPVKAEDNENTYEFIGWKDKEGKEYGILPMVTEDVAYIARFKAVQKLYDVIFYNRDEQNATNFVALQSDKLPYNENVTFTGREPTKPLNAEAGYDYEFLGWTPAIHAVAAPTAADPYPNAYIAEYNKTKQKYTLTFYYDDGQTVYSSATLDYGSAITAPTVNPTKKADAEYTYAFAGWKNNTAGAKLGGALIQDTTFTAMFTANRREYTITFVNEDNVELNKAQFYYGVRPYYLTGQGWPVPTKPAKLAQNGHEYKFLGWIDADGNEYINIPLPVVTEDATYMAIYDDTLTKYRITFASPSYAERKKEDGTFEVTSGKAYQVTYVPYGEPAVYSGPTPTKETVNGVKYTFAGWDQPLTTVTEDKIYKAKFIEDTLEYDVNWYTYDGQLIDYYKQVYKYGDQLRMQAQIPRDPAKDDLYTYEFKGWEPDAPAHLGKDKDGKTTVTGPINFYAQYTATPRQYTVTFMNEGTKLSERKDYKYLERAVYPGSTPTKTDDSGEFTYTFKGWRNVAGELFEGALAPVTQDEVYTAVYESAKQSYRIWFVNDDEAKTVLQESLVEYGQTPEYTLGVDPVSTKASTDKGHTYTFTGWSPARHPVTGEAVYTALYNTQANVYTITFLNEDGSTYLVNTQEYGEAIQKPTIEPKKASDDYYTYTFAGWVSNTAGIEVGGIVICDVTFTARFTKEERLYTVQFVNDDGTLLEAKKTYKYGDIPYYDRIPVKSEATKLPGVDYTFKGWIDSRDGKSYTILNPVDGDVEFMAEYTKTVSTYKITFALAAVDSPTGKDIILQESKVPYGTVPSFDGAMPVKAPKDGKTYSFYGWTPAKVAATKDAVYYATFMEATDVYPVFYRDEDGTLLYEQQYKYKDVITYPDVDPVKDADWLYTYEFAGWLPDAPGNLNTNGEVLGYITFTAQYERTLRGYNVDWVNDDGSSLHREKYTIGEIPNFKKDTPQSTALGKPGITYTFAGWRDSRDGKVYQILPAIDGPAQFLAVYAETKTPFEITWYNDNNTTILQRSSVIAGDTPVYMGVAPTSTKAATDPQYSYTFTGWTPNVVPAEGNAEYYATYSKSIKRFKVTWIDGDGNVLLEQTAKYGDEVVYTGAMPTKSADAQYTYEFTGWYPDASEPVEITNDTTFVAQFKSTERMYTVTFVDENGFELEDKPRQYTYGTPAAKIKVPEMPLKKATVSDTFNFVGWYPMIAPVTADVVYKAVYEKEERLYLVAYMNDDAKSEIRSFTKEEAATREFQTSFSEEYNSDGKKITTIILYKDDGNGTITETKVTGTLLQKDWLRTGTVPSYTGIDPVSTLDPHQYFTEFTGWAPSEVPTMMDTVYVANYNLTERTFNITWLDGDRKVLYTQEMKYGEQPIYAGAEPTKTPTDGTTYKFNGKWIPEIDEDTIVKGDATYTAQFDAKERTYSVTFVDSDGTSVLMPPTNYKYGTEVKDIAQPETPTKAPDGKQSYTFSGWQPMIHDVTEDVVYRATYNGEVVTYNITWLVDGVEQKEKVPYGETPVYQLGATPKKASDKYYDYIFAGWDREIVPVTADTTYEAIFTKTPRLYTTIWFTGTTWTSEKHAYGSVLTPPANPVRDGYVFLGWSPKVPTYMPAEDMEFIALWQQRQFMIKFLNYDGTLLQAGEVGYGDLPIYSGVAPKREMTEDTVYTFIGWTPEIGAVTGDTTYVATYEESVRTYKIRFLDPTGKKVLQSTDMTYGSKPVFKGDTPTKDTDGKYTYYFAGWTPTIKKVTEEVDYKPVFKTTRNYALLATMKSLNKTTQRLTWTKVSNVKGYDIFFNQCNSATVIRDVELIKTIEGNKTFKYNLTGLKKGVCYKAVVKAFRIVNGEKVYVAVSPAVHSITGDYTKKLTNTKSIKVNATKVTLRVGSKKTLKMTLKAVKSGRTILDQDHVELKRFFSNNTNVAKVSAKGVITAVGKGTCTIYAMAPNGLYKTIKVTVKK